MDEHGQYLSWDITRDRKIIRELAWPKDASLVVLDELHKAPKWKNLLKGVADEFGNRPPVLVTGSARLDAFRESGDALTGRHYFYRLHPIDVASSLLKFAHFRNDTVGENWDVYYLRDKEQREVDFVVTLNRRVHWLIEVKSSDATVSNNLKYYTEKLHPRQSLQPVLQLDRAQEKSGIKMVPLGKWLDSLEFD